MKVIAADWPVQLVRYPGTPEAPGSTFAVRVIDASRNEAADVFRSRRRHVAREQYDIERHYRCVRRTA